MDKNEINIIKVAAAVFVALAIAGLFAWKIAKSKKIEIDPQEYYKVSYVVDGDTFKARVGTQTITVRELGINTPETVDSRKPVECFGHEASDENKRLLIGRKVRLELNPNREKTDKYGRYLLYVYLEDGSSLNAHMIQEGFAREYTVGTPYSKQAEFRADESQAKVAKKGLWAACPN